MGLGADCVSGPEVQKALDSGFKPHDIVFAGVGKTDQEIILGLENNIACFNCESLHELEVIDLIAKSLHKKAPVAVRINPDINGNTHLKITTGTKYDKFGISIEDIPAVISQLKKAGNLEFKGLHFHIGSQITDMQIFSRLANGINEIQDIFIQNGLTPSVLNLGGGLGVNYQSPDSELIPDYGSFFHAYLKNINRLSNQEIFFELGRSIVAQCGSLLSRVLYLKKSDDSTYAIIDAGMNNLMRPALYGAEHKIQNLTGLGPASSYHIAGPVCESSDIFGKNLALPELKRGDLIAIRTAGAYGEVMSSGYNLRNRARAFYSHEIKMNMKYEVVSI
jgi:diaminopimelate decarboxylase